MKKASIFFALIVALAIPAFAQEAGRSADYQVGPRDVLDIKVFQDPNLNSQPRVSDDGKVSLPLLQTVDVRGLTARQIEAKLKTLLEEKYFAKADVSVAVIEFENAPISVLGAVNRPGKIAVGGSMSLLQAISAAGGLATGHGRNLYVLRTSESGLSDQLEIDVEALIVRGDPEVNIPVEPNDLINVPNDVTLSIYVLGEVMKQGVVELRSSQDATLLKAIAAAGGATDRAKLSGITIKRVVDGKESNIKVNFDRIIAGKAPDVKLQNDDRIFVPESFF